MRRNTPVGMTACGFQTLSLANSTALGLNTTCIVGKVFQFSVETNDVRVRVDGVAPALTTGVLYQSDQTHWMFDVPAAGLKFQRSTGTSKVSIMAYKYTGL
jgi:hypothetical protein